MKEEGRGGMMEMEISKELVGKRVLYRIYPYLDIKEGVIKEISPSGNYIKIGGVWYPTIGLTIIEELEDGK